jgi:hypothetical protein
MGVGYAAVDGEPVRNGQHETCFALARAEADRIAFRLRQAAPGGLHRERTIARHARREASVWTAECAIVRAHHPPETARHRIAGVFRGHQRRGDGTAILVDHRAAHACELRRGEIARRRLPGRHRRIGHGGVVRRMRGEQRVRARRHDQ